MGRRWLLIVGALICGVIHFAVGAMMAVYGHHVDSVDGKHQAVCRFAFVKPPAEQYR